MTLPVAGNSYSYAQLEGLWINAGGSRALAPTMAAIAEAESGGRPNARNPSGATGLWQILGAVNPADAGRLTNPQVNAHEAVLKYQSQGLSAWTTYTSGAYKQFLSPRTSPDTNVPGNVGTSSGTSATPTQLGGPGSPCILGFGGFLGFGSFCAFSKTEARALVGGLLLLGGTLVTGVGLAVLVAGAFTETKAGRQAAQGLQKAAAVVPEARAATALRSAAKGARAARGARRGTQRGIRGGTVLREGREPDRMTVTRQSRSQPALRRGRELPPAESSRQRSARYARSSGAASRSETGF